MTTVTLKAPYLIVLGDVTDPLDAKTGMGVAYWAHDRCAGQLRLPGCTVDADLPDLDAEGAINAGVRTVIVGIAAVGGRLQPGWIPALTKLASQGIDVASGLHSKLADVPELVAAARSSGASLIDVRTPPDDLPCGLGERRSGKRVITVGTDCAVGKKYSALALHRELLQQGVAATFRATGQTGIMIAGNGIPIDAVVGDFIAGAAEVLSPDNDDAHWDVIEGQGSLVHPAYAGVTIGLLHGSQPDAIVLCHDAGRTAILDTGCKIRIPPLDELIDYALRAARLTNADCFCAGISVNASRLSAGERDNYLEELRARHGLPVVDPLATGMRPIASFMLDQIAAER